MKVNSSILLLFSPLLLATCLAASKQEEEESSIYEVLRSHGLPIGLLPKGVTDYRFNENSGRFEVHLEEPCIAKFENSVQYEKNVSGVLRYGEIQDVSGISAQELFLWFQVNDIRVDVPSSGLIYFDVGVIKKQFSLSLFETSPSCNPVPPVDKSLSRNPGYEFGARASV